MLRTSLKNVGKVMRNLWSHIGIELNTISEEIPNVFESQQIIKDLKLNLNASE